MRDALRSLERLLVAAPRCSTRIAQGAAAAVLFVGVCYAVLLGEHLRYPDEREYFELAANLAESGEYSLDGVQATAFRPPAYPALLGVFRFLGLGVVGLRLIGVVTYAAVILAIYALAKHLGGPAAGAIAAVFTACYPLFLYTACTLFPQTALTALLLVTLLSALRILTSTGRTRVVASTTSGLVGGVLALTAPSFGVMVPLIAGWLVWHLRRRALLPVVLVLGAAAVPVSAWAARNYSALDSLVPVSTNGGVNLLLGNSPAATPSTGSDADISAYEAEATRRGLGEVDRDRFYRAEAVTWMREHPGDALTLYGGKLLHNFAWHDDLVTGSEESLLKDLALAVTFVPLLLLVTLRVVFLRRVRLRAGEGLLLLTYAVNLLSLGVFFTRLRFRVPLDALMITSAAVFVARLVRPQGEALSARSTSPIGVPAIN